MSLKLLIAEDEEMIRVAMEKYIQLHTDRFSHIYLASNGQEALDIIMEHEPQLMLLDINMPVKSGVEVMKESDKMGLMPKTIILSGYESFEYAKQAIRYGAVEYLLKPSRSSDILESINNLADTIEGTEKTEAEEENQAHYGVNIAMEYMAEHYNEDLTLHKVADQAGISAGYLSTLLNQELNCGFADYLNQLRVDKACVYLEQNYFKSYEIAYKVGFHDEKYFAKVFKKLMNMSPTEYRKSKTRK